MNDPGSLRHHGERFQLVMGSDVQREGIFLELWDIGPPRQLTMWAFYSDADQSFAFEQYRPEVPTEVSEWFTEEARRRLPPIAVPSHSETDPR
jgi:hypothetical protein